MLKTYLFVFIASVQIAFGLISTVTVMDSNHKHVSFHENRPSALNPDLEDNNPQNFRDPDYIAEIKKLGIKLHSDTDFDSNSIYNPDYEKHCAALVYRTFSVMSPDTVSKVKNLTFYYNSTGRRGLGGSSTIVLRCQNISDREFVSVLVHELGHVHDIGVLNGNFWAGKSEFMDGSSPIYLDDPSLKFYKISFLNDKKRKETARDADFVTGYAMTDPFEDFAESYNFYLLHGAKFRSMTRTNAALQEKYDFMRKYVFDGQEFDFSLSEDGNPSEMGNSFLDENLSIRNYDSTVLAFDLKKFLKNT